MSEVYLGKCEGCPFVAEQVESIAQLGADAKQLTEEAFDGSYGQDRDLEVPEFPDLTISSYISSEGEVMDVHSAEAEDQMAIDARKFAATRIEEIVKNQVNRERALQQFVNGCQGPVPSARDEQLICRSPALPDITA
jgi:hypothetical protein